MAHLLIHLLTNATVFEADTQQTDFTTMAPGENRNAKYRHGTTAINVLYADGNAQKSNYTTVRNAEIAGDLFITTLE